MWRMKSYASGRPSVLSGLFPRACGPQNFMKKVQSGKMEGRCGEIGKAVDKSRLLVCLIRSMCALSK